MKLGQLLIYIAIVKEKDMRSILLILGSEITGSANGQFNKSLFDVARQCLAPKYDLSTSIIETGYDVEEEIEKFKKADVIIYQYPVFWFMVPASVKKYMDQVYKFGEFFTRRPEAYGSGGLMTGKAFMLSTTWNAPVEAFNDESKFFDGCSVEDALLPMRKSHAYCGFNELRHFSCHNVIAAPNYETDRERYIAHLKSVFGL